jgi:hypothetical protein
MSRLDAYPAHLKETIPFSQIYPAQAPLASIVLAEEKALFCDALRLQFFEFFSR